MLTLQEKIINLCPDIIIKIVFPSWIKVRQFINSVAEEIPPNSLVLDAGAGQCQYKSLFKNHNYFAIDAAVGEQAWDYSRLDVICNLDQIPFFDNTFDSIICTQVLEHVKEPQMIINEAYRILKSGGFLYLSAPQGWGVHQAPNDFFRFTNYGLRYLFENAGFQISFIEPSCGYFGYLSNRVSMLPKFIFWNIKNPIIRIMLFPFELISYLVFSLLVPVILNSMDFIDGKREYTLNYFVKGQKPRQ